MGAECAKCGHDLPYNGECVVCGLAADLEEAEERADRALLDRDLLQERVDDQEAELRAIEIERDELRAELELGDSDG